MSDLGAIYRSVMHNEYYFTVEFPADWADEPILAGTKVTFYYPTEQAAKLALDGFRSRGVKW